MVGGVGTKNLGNEGRHLTIMEETYLQQSMTQHQRLLRVPVMRIDDVELELYRLLPQ